MVGAIRRRDILAHPIVTIRSFGWTVFFRAMVAGRNRTFLSLLAETGVMQSPTVQVPELVDRCVELELRAKQIYGRLAQQFDQHKAATEFFATLARQERSHAELLKLCKAAAGRGGWSESQFAGWRQAVPRLVQEMEAAKASLRTMEDLASALQLVIQIESSEINSVFQAVVVASQSDFVKTLRAFQTAGSRHVAYIRNEITRLDPALAEQCRQLRGPGEVDC